MRRYVAYGDVPEGLLNTSALERQNLMIRLFGSRMRRRTVTFGRSREAVQSSLELFKSYYDLCLPHSTLSVKKKENNGIHMDVTRDEDRIDRPCLEHRRTDVLSL